MQHRDTDHNSVVDYSEDLKNIIGKPPNKLVRFGGFTLVIVLILLVTVLYIIQYPEEERGDCVILTDPAPLVIGTASNGTLAEVLVADGEVVAQNKVLAVLESTAKYTSVVKLGSIIDSCFKNLQNNNFHDLFIPPFLAQIGELSEPLNSAYWNWLQIKIYTSDPKFQRIQYGIMVNQKNNSFQKVDMPAERADSKSFQKDFFNSIATFTHSLNELRAGIADWKSRNVLTAPLAGRVYFPNVVYKNMEVYVGKPFLYVVPVAKDRYAQMIISQESFDRIQKEQKVNIAIPGMKKILLEGKVSGVSPILDKEGNFSVKIKIKDAQNLLLDRMIDTRHELHGTGTIITGQKSLLAKLIGINTR
jgi:hypothetical protein